MIPLLSLSESYQRRRQIYDQLKGLGVRRTGPAGREAIRKRLVHHDELRRGRSIVDALGMVGR